MKNEQTIYAEPVLRVVAVNELPNVVSATEPAVMHAVTGTRTKELFLLTAPSLPQFDDYKIKAKTFDPL